VPFAIPTLPELRDAIHDEIDARLPGADSRLRRSILDVLARIVAGGTWLQYAWLEWLGLQVFVDTAEAEFLARHAAIRGLARTPAAFAAGDVDLIGEDGTQVLEGTRLRRADGIEYATAALATIAGGTATVAVVASAPGASGDADAGTTLTMVEAFAGVEATATVAAAGLTGGRDEESDEDLRERVLTHIQQPPHGGAHFDYIRWAKEVAGVTRVWVEPSHFGLGSVGVFFVRDQDAGSILPDPGEVQSVRDHIDAVRPVTADVTVIAPTEEAVDFEIALTPDTAEVRAAVVQELIDVLFREGRPGGTILLSHIREAISAAAGETDHTLVAPVANVTVAAGALPTLGTMTWS